MEELEKKKLELEESYNFKLEKGNSYSFEYKNKKAFIINLSLKINESFITPFILRRGQLGIACDELFNQLDNEEKPNINTNKFVHLSIEIIGNLLDITKMGSPENFFNYVWDDIKDTENIIDVVTVLGDIITMIDYATEKQLGKLPEGKVKEIHKKFFSKMSEGINEKIKPDPEPDDPHGLRYMTPLNLKEI